MRRIDDKSMIEIQWPETEVRKSKPGWLERNEHIALMRAGQTAYAVIVTAKNVNVNPRQIDFYNAKEVFKLGDMLERDGITYAAMVTRLPIREVRGI